MDTVTLSVSELCLAATDAEWRARWMRGERPGVQVFAPPGTVAVHGTKFHALAAQLVNLLLVDNSLPADADVLFERLVDGGGGDFLDALMDEGQVDSAAQLTTALHALAVRIARLRSDRSAPAWSDVFLAPEFSVKDARFETDDGLAFVSGTIDCVRHRPGGGLVVVEYKLTRGADLAKEMVQVAIYRELLKRARGTESSGVLEYFSPALQVVELSEGDLQGAFEQWVVPALSAMIRSRQGKPRQAAIAHTADPAPPAASPDAPAADAGGFIRLGTARSASGQTVTLDPEQLKRHVAFLGGSGSGKTTLALSVLEQLLLRGVPVVLVDRKGDLAGYGDPRLREAAGANERLRRLLDAVEVAVFTPGQDLGRPLGISLLPSGLEQAQPSERAEAYRDAAASLGAMLLLKPSAADQAKYAVLVQALRTLGESRPAAEIGFDELIELLGDEDPAFLESLGRLDPKHGKKLAEQLQSMAIMRGNLLARGADALSAELLFGLGAHRRSGKARLSIISTKSLGDDVASLFWISHLLLELNRFASRSPSPTLQAAVVLDEADVYLPATSKPPTKAPLESLLKRARSAGISVMLATQSPGDLDYKCRDNVRTWFIGLVKETRALDKLKPLLSDAKIDASVVLPKQKVGQFFMLSETMAVPITAERNLVETRQLPETEIIAIARRSRG